MASRGSYLLKAIRLLTPAVLALVTALMAFYVNARWVAVMVSAALAYGFLSSIVAARRLYFLAGASAHSALLAAVLALPLTAITGLLSEQGWALIVGLVLMYAVGYLIYRGVEPDTATAVFVAATASASVLAIYYVLTRFPVEVELWAIIVGDPLLASREEAIFALSVAAITVLTTLLTYREQVYVGIDREFARLTGLRVWAYDLLTFTLLALTTVGLIKVVGFVLEHVLLLLPSAIGVRLSRSSRGVLAISACSSLSASLAGLCLAILLDQSPAGVVGLILLSAYVASLLAVRR